MTKERSVSMKNATSYLVAIAAVLVWTSPAAAAADNVCPGPGAITKSASLTPDGDTAYEAAVAGHAWKGEISQYDDDLDLTSLSFAGASIQNAKHYVLCNYFGSNRSALRMRMDTSANVVPVDAAAWKAGDKGALVCTQSDVSKCAFK
jgi:hypothetical protein